MTEEAEAKASPLPYVPKTDAELERLAQDIVADRVFHSIYHADAMDAARVSLSIIFMPLAFADQMTMDWLKANRINASYEYFDKAAPRSCNGMPSFFTVNFMSEEDSHRLHARVVELDEFQRKRLAAAGAG